METVTQRTVVGTHLASIKTTSSRLRSVLPIQSHKRETLFNTTTLAAGVASLSLFASQPVEAAQEIATLAAGDSRLGAVAFLFVPALAWVLFNIGGPATRQLEDMQGAKPKSSAPRAVSSPAAKKKVPAKKR